MIVFQKIKNRFLNLKLSKKLYLSYLLLFLVPVLAFSSYTIEHTRQVMQKNMESAVLDNANQIAQRIGDQLSDYDTMLSSMIMNTSLSTFFQETNASYYQRYDGLVNMYEPIVRALMELQSDFEQLGVYTENETFSKRNLLIIPIRDFEHREWLDQVMVDHNVHWFVSDDELIGLGQLIHLTRKAPRTVVFCRVPISCLFRFDPESLQNYEFHVLNDTQTIYSYGNIEATDHIMTVNTTIGETGWQLRLSRASNLFQEDFPSVLGAMLLLTLVCVGLTISIGKLVSGTVTRRVDDMNRMMSQVETGNLNLPEIPIYDDELGEMAVHFGNMAKSLQEYIHNAYENEITRNKAELKALQAQINPHFLYNSLSYIRWKALSDNNEEISDLVMCLSNFYRLALNHGQSEMTVQDEVNIVDNYLTVQMCMHEESFSIDLVIDPEIMDYTMIGLILQPLIENAIDHGLDQRREPGGKLVISGTQERDEICFSIWDNGPGMHAEQFRKNLEKSTKGYGLKNVNDRLLIAYGSEYGLQIDEFCSEGTRIFVRIPINN